MLRFASPLPKNYHQIVRIFKEVRENDVMEVEEVNQPLSIPTPTPIQTPPPPQQQVLLSPVSNDPFLSNKPPIFTQLNETQLIQANPMLNDAYLQEREELLKARQEAQADKEKKYLEETKMDVPQELIDKRKQEFEDAQEQLRMLRQEATANVSQSETKQKGETELTLPPANAQPQARNPIARPQNLRVSKEKLMTEIEQPPPPANIQQPIESLRLDQLKPLCAARGISTKGNKPDLIQRLKSAGILYVLL